MIPCMLIIGQPLGGSETHHRVLTEHRANLSNERRSLNREFDRVTARALYYVTFLQTISPARQTPEPANGQTNHH